LQLVTAHNIFTFVSFQISEKNQITVRKTCLSLSIICLLLSFLLLPVVKAGSHSYKPEVVRRVVSAATSVVSSVEFASNLLYDSLHLNRLGLNKQALLYAYKGQQQLVKKGRIENSGILTVCDFTQPSTQKRMYIIDLKNFKVLMNTYVAHGKNSGLEYAQRFSNSPSSLKSSLGFYETKNIYFGKNGLSLKLIGLERGFNDKAEARAVVIHGARYIGEQRSDAAYMGRSFGCPAVPQVVASKVIELIKNGTCFFIYHPSKNYLHGSKILNG
jgi:hypothetical protein